ncbi:hypothetical protein [Priestia filamentosa]
MISLQRIKNHQALTTIFGKFLRLFIRKYWMFSLNVMVQLFQYGY